MAKVEEVRKPTEYDVVITLSRKEAEALRIIIGSLSGGGILDELVSDLYDELALHVGRAHLDQSAFVNGESGRLNTDFPDWD